jgi:hypothetical protein
MRPWKEFKKRHFVMGIAICHRLNAGIEVTLLNDKRERKKDKQGVLGRTSL